MPKTKKIVKKEIKKKIKKAEPKIEEKPKIEETEEKFEEFIFPKVEKYFQSEGRRKTSLARLRLWTKGEREFLVNNKPLEKYFPTAELQKNVLAPLEIMKCLDKFKISAKVKGGGLSGQAEAIRHALARVLVSLNPNFRKRLKKAGFLKRDSRIRERKKFGLKRARRAPQWAKR